MVFLLYDTHEAHLQFTGKTAEMPRSFLVKKKEKNNGKSCSGLLSEEMMQQEEAYDLSVSGSLRDVNNHHQEKDPINFKRSGILQGADQTKLTLLPKVLYLPRSHG